MGAKEDLLQDLTSGDASGGVERIHTALIASGLKYKGPRNTKQPPAKAGGFVLRTESPDTRRLNDASTPAPSGSRRSA